MNESSVRKHFLAYRDVPWDDPEHRLDPDDPRLCLSPESPLGQSAWYQALTLEQRVRFGLERACEALQVGIEFESALSRGLLEYAATLEARRPEFRYALHEVVEECQHIHDVS